MVNTYTYIPGVGQSIYVSEQQGSESFNRQVLLHRHDPIMQSSSQHPKSPAISHSPGERLQPTPAASVSEEQFAVFEYTQLISKSSSPSQSMSVSPAGYGAT